MVCKDGHKSSCGKKIQKSLKRVPRQTEEGGGKDAYLVALKELHPSVGRNIG